MLRDRTSPARMPSSDSTDKSMSNEPGGSLAVDLHVHSGPARVPSGRLSSQSSQHLRPTIPTPLQLPEIRSLRRYSDPIQYGNSVISYSSLPLSPKISSKDPKADIAPRTPLKAFRDPIRRVSTESQRADSWRSESESDKRESSGQFEMPKEKLAAKGPRRLPLARNLGSPELQSNSLNHHGGYARNRSILSLTNPANTKTKRPSFQSRTGSSSEKSQSRSGLLRTLYYMSPTYPHFRSPTGEPEGLYCKTKRGIGEGFMGKPKEDAFRHVFVSQEELPSRATATIEGAARVLGRSRQDTAWTNTQLYAGGRSPSMNSQRSDTRTEIAPWHRRNSQESTWSFTSSIREVLGGKTPTSTPNSAMQYVGHKGKKYAKVDITRGEEPNFLPSEAALVPTPSEIPAGITSRHSLGFFLDPTPPSNDRDTGAISRNETLVPSPASRSAMKPQIAFHGNREWWDSVEAGLDSEAPAINTQVEPLIRGQIEHPRFEWSTPEHLPNSPLCPLSQKWDSGDNIGICVFHGRKGRFEG